MAVDVLARSAGRGPLAVSGMGLVAIAVLAAWLLVVFLLGAAGAFATPPGTPPIPIAIGAAGPILLFLAGFRLSRPFREFALKIDPRVIVAVQAWRFAGLGFLALNTHGVLPGLFTWPAGLGDIAIAATAPWMMVALLRQPRFVADRAFVAWNALGILDLVVAVGTGALASALASGVAGEITTGPMAQLPLVLIPAYFVPIFIMLHIVALTHARRFAG